MDVVLMKKRKALERFLSHIETPDGREGCWLWTGAKNEDGYGRFSYENRLWLPHKWLWELGHGPVPEGLVLDHLPHCRNRACVNPTHLEPITQQDNVKRGNYCRAKEQETAQ